MNQFPHPGAAHYRVFEVMGDLSDRVPLEDAEFIEAQVQDVFMDD